MDLYELDASHDFLQRHIGPNVAEQKAMLRDLGFESLEQMVDAVIPQNILDREAIEKNIPASISENDILVKLEKISQKNIQIKSLIGQGYYNNHTPEVIIRNIMENPGWYTAYTPYQAEISQGRLEALANFQTMVMDLTGLDLANASLLDEGTAAAEAMTLCARATKLQANGRPSKRFFVSQNCHPQSIDVILSRAEPLGIEVIVGSEDGLPQDIFGAIFQYPGTLGEIKDYSELILELHKQGSLVILATDLLALTLLKTPGDMGADIAIGSAQRFGVPLNFGGPHAAFMAVRNQHQRSMPGRIIGVSKDRHGQPAYRMAVQTREQHIRREKATSNICTAQALLAIIASFYGAYFGPEGLKRVARRVNGLARVLAQGIRDCGYSLESQNFFDTVVVYTGAQSDYILQLALENGYNLRKVDTNRLGISLDDTSKISDIKILLHHVFGYLKSADLPDINSLIDSCTPSIPENLLRNSPFMEHEVFHKNHSETQMMRYMRSLVNKDIALDRSMIPLGSCTMKLNAAVEMKAVTLSGFAHIHPFAPPAQTQGYQQLIRELEYYLCAVTGYNAFSLQPNAGSQGEYAGLIAIRKYYQSIGQGQRRVCLIPVSAHGTNPASAQMAGMQVVVVQCDSDGNIDSTDLENKCAEYQDTLACIMITYPSTHGVFETNIREICALVHQYGGQVYIDGANMNAQVGLAYPSEYGGDVSHLNLHKTFCIPHGGGGPGVGPIGVKAHLAPFLPGHSVVENGRAKDGAVASAPWGSPSILVITYAYILLMGGKGLRKASEVAILSANYIAKKLEPYYPVLYKGESGFVAHECIIDIRTIEKETGISCEDIAKRLMDFGIHAPTMSFPVPGTLMIEPTESEPLEELDRFIEAMLTIRGEIEDLRTGQADPADNVLKNAPHTMAEVTANEWVHSYSREKAAFPVASLKKNKIWPAVARIDNVYGDRNLFCACIPASDFL